MDYTGKVSLATFLLPEEAASTSSFSSRNILYSEYNFT